MLAVEEGRVMALSPLVYFVSRSQPPVKASHRSFVLYYCYYCCCDMCLRSGGCPVASCDSPYTGARAASACCLLPQLRSCLLQCSAYVSNYVPRSDSFKMLLYVRQPLVAVSSTDGVEKYKLVVSISVAFGDRDWSTSDFPGPPTAKFPLPLEAFDYRSTESPA